MKCAGCGWKDFDIYKNGISKNHKFFNGRIVCRNCGRSNPAYILKHGFIPLKEKSKETTNKTR